MSKRLVIDACVARASGGPDATLPRSKTCRDILQSVLVVCHRAVMTPQIREEWNRHQSAFARQWRTSMVARKKLELIDVPHLDIVREKVTNDAETDSDRREMLKDFHIIEAAMGTDRIVISTDRAAHMLFDRLAASSVGELRPIMWANPEDGGPELSRWLEDGAGAERGKFLGSGIQA